METNNSNTTMMPGKVINIADRRSANSGVGPKPPVSTPEETRPQKKEEVREKEVKKIPEIKEVDIKKSENIVIFADYIADKAKKDGVDAAFEELARQEIEETKSPSKLETLTKTPEPVKTENVDINPNEIAQTSEIQDPIEAQAQIMMRKVEELSAENEDLKKQLGELREVNRQVLMTTYELVMILKKMIEEEEDEKKKKGTLELLINLMTKILVLLMAGEEEAEKIGKDDEDDETVIEKLIA